MNCNFCGNNTWLIIILILLFCGGFNCGCGNENGCGNTCGNNCGCGC